MIDWRKSREYRAWRSQIIRRDKRCVICDSIKTRHAHHIHDGSSYPAQRFDVENGVCLCGECHKQFHCNYKKSYRKSCNMDDFCNFKELMDYGMGLTFVQIDRSDNLKALFDTRIGLAEVMKAPDPEAAQILEDNLWDVV